jgi:hypothetical protein
MSQRFTIDGRAELEQRLADICELVRTNIATLIPGAKLEGLVLAGGYGRGEGGVLRENGRDLPYNDLEFFVFIHGSTFLNDRRYKAALHNLGERLSPAAGLDVEFKIFSLHKLRHSKPGMFFYDLVMGHRWLIGDDELFRDCDHHRDAAQIPLHEATRLLFNRCTGLLFAKERLARAEFTAADADFVGRNLAKAQLALGDVLLASHGQYHWSCQERHRRLQLLPEASEAIREHHAHGVAFKLHPLRSTLTRAELANQHSALSVLAGQVFLNLETQRLGKKFDSAVEYGTSSINKCPEQPIWRNLLVHLKTRGLPLRLTRYPREHLLHGLALMLWGCQAVTPESVRAYEALWCRFN